MAQSTRSNRPQIVQKLADLVANDPHPPVIYRTTSDGSRLRCVWNPSIQDYDCVEVHADGIPRDRA
jgi:hypothetical protein